MGCDIHMFAEKRNIITKMWEKIGEVFDYAYFNPDKPVSEYNTPKTDEPFHNRSYNTFAILADVRNGSGFAGIKTGEGFNPISEPRGLPEDVSEEIFDESDKWDGDGHSHSFFTVKELKEYDWNQITGLRGTISLQQYQAIKKGDNPGSYSGSISGPKIITISMEKADAHILNPDPSYERFDVYVDYHWNELYKDSASRFYNTTIPALEALGDPEDVRIVFFFDN